MVEKKDFAESIKLFYSKFLNAMADNIDSLASIEEEFKEEYKDLKEIQKDPTLILEKLGDLEEEKKDELIAMFIRVSKLESKMLRLFDLNAEEKRKFSKEVRELSKNLSKK